MAQIDGHAGNTALSFLRAGNDMAERVRGHDWSSTSLGPLATWPAAITTLVGIMLTSSQPMFLALGTERVWLYNDAFTPILGRKHPSALGQPSMAVWAEARAQLEPLFDKVFAGEAVHLEDFALLLDRTGELEESHFTFSYNPVHDEQGQVSGLFGVCVETTRQVLNARMVASQREKFSQLFDLSPSFMVVLSGPQHRIELANPRYFELVGFRPIVGKTVAEILPEAVPQGYVDLLDNVFRTGQPFAARGSKYAVQPTPGGPVNERYLDFVYQPITDSNDVVVGIFVEGVDVTDRKQAELVLQEAKENLERAVAERTADLRNIQTFYTHSTECHAILAQREDGAFQYDELNPATLRLYGKSRDEVIGRTLHEVFSAVQADELSGHMAAALRQSAPYRYVRRLGAITVEAVVSLIPSAPGERRRVAVSARDVTERETLEDRLRQAQKMEALGQLTGGIAHDFNNLLGGLSGNLELLEKRLAQGRLAGIERYIANAQDASRRAATLTQRLLAFSRRQSLDVRPTDANRLIAGMSDLIRRTVGPSVAVEFVGAGGLWLTRIDASQLESSLLNLCINARDAMEPDGGRLTIETANKWLDERAAAERELPPGQYVSVCVTDTGTGMTPEVIARAFDPFYTTKPLGAGTGLGLSMVQGFVRQSGGQVRIYSEIGEGTTICLYLPRYFGDAEVVISEPEVPFDPGAGETILVIDDEPALRSLVAEVLIENGYTVLEAVDGPSGLRILQSDVRIDLLVTDVGLPGGLNGRQVADAARVTRPDLKILFITGFAENAVIGKRHLSVGMSVITKPFQIASFASKVRQLIDR